MEKIESFKVDHRNLLPGLYVSRQDKSANTTVTTFDLRFTRPNSEPCMDSAAIHTIEHIGATLLRNGERASEIVYFGPMGCKTGFYLVMFGDLAVKDVLDLVKGVFLAIVDWQGDIPGATEKECGNYLLQNLKSAQYYAKQYLADLEKYKSFAY